MRNILYITFADKNHATGGGQCTSRNLQSIKQIMGDDHVYTYILRPGDVQRNFQDKLYRIIDILRGYMGGVTSFHLKEIIKQIRQYNITDVFIDNSQLGLIARSVKKRYPDIFIYTFFHNVEYDFMRSTIWRGKDYAHLYWIFEAYVNEKTACKYSDQLIALTDSDASRLLQLYGREVGCVIPITMSDNYHDVEPDNYQPCSATSPQALFLGSYFTGNVEGLKWFCEEVLPHVDMRLSIVGSGMEQIKNDIKPSPKVMITSFVEDLSLCFEQSDFVILPIVSGGGMKVKTAESLKFGKYIIGTKEALEGYEITSEHGIECNTKDAFVAAINGFNRRYKYCKASRDLFKQKYSNEVALNKYKKILAR